MQPEEEVARLQQAAVENLLPEMMERVDWPAQRVKEFRASALRSFIARLKSQSPWHSQRLSDVDADNFSEEELVSIPPMAKADLMTHFDEIVIDRHLTLDRCRDHIRVETSGGGYINSRYRVSTTGGSSGSPALMVFSWEEAARQWATFARIIFRWAARTGNRDRAPVVASITAPSAVFHGQHVVRFFSTAGPNTIPVTAPISEIVERLNRANPNILMLYPSIIPRLVLEAEAGRLKITPMLFITVAEPLLAEHEAAISRICDSPVINGWGTTEVGALAMGSGFEPGLLLVDDEVIIEPVDRKGKPINPGERAEKVYVTPLFRSTLPLLRYELTDQFVLSAEQPGCGSSFRRISNVEGRLDDYFKYDGDIEVQPGFFREALSRESTALEYQVRQTNDGAHIILTSSAPIDCRRLSGTIEAGLRRLGISEPGVTVERVDEIERTGDAAKLKRFVPVKNQSSREP
ncbi:MAG TPA: hypothetical protein VKA70_15140 [Blastocatellia bacterium]|nr:hypothetical protein [Blastocatellia bacterium]